MAVTMVAFLPPVSADSSMDGFCRSMVMPVSVPPVRITKSTSGWVTRRDPTLPPEHGTNCSTLREIPARQKH